MNYLTESSFKSKALIKYQQYVIKSMSSQRYLNLHIQNADILPQHVTGFSKHFIRNMKIFEKISFTSLSLHSGQFRLRFS